MQLITRILAQIANLISVLVGSSILDISILWVVLVIHVFCAVPVAGSHMGGFENMDQSTFKYANKLIVQLILYRLLFSAVACGIGYVGYLIFL